MDSIFARAIKRIQQAYIKGIKTLVDIFIEDKGLEKSHLNNYSIRMTSPSTAEDKKRDETFASRISAVADFMDLISQEDLTDPETRKKVLVYFITSFMNRPDVASMLNEDETADSVNEEDVEAPDYGGSGGGANFDVDIDSGGGDFGGNFDEGGPEDLGGGLEQNPEGSAIESDLDIGANSQDAEFEETM